MTVDKELKAYKQRVKDSRTSLELVQARAQEIADAKVQSEDARTSLTEVQSEIGSVTADKDLLREQVSEASILNDPGLSEMTEQYKGLAERVDELEAEAVRLSKIIEDCTPDDEHVALLKAQLHTFNGADGSSLLKAVQDTVKANDDALREATRACESLLPSVESLAVLKALSDKPGYRGLYDSFKDSLEHATDLGRADETRKMIDYKVERLLSR